MISKLKNCIFRFRDRMARTPEKRAELYRDIVKMGENCEIFAGVSFGSEPYLITLGNNVKLTANVRFITHDGGMYVLRNNGFAPNADKFGKIEVGNNVFIGIESIIMPGVNIGDNVVIGCGSIVTKNIPSNTVVAGIPAKIISSIEDYYEKNRKFIAYTKNLNMEEKKRYLLKNTN